MGLPSEKRKESLKKAAAQYQNQVKGSPADQYLSNRGLDVREPGVVPFGLGYVGEAFPGHEPYQGMLSIPYIRRSPRGDLSVVDIRFRCLNPDCDHKDHAGGKYVSLPESEPRMFHTEGLMSNQDIVAICEGELDTVTAVACRIPAVGVGGASTWQDHYPDMFEGYETVFILADNDDGGAGLKFARKVAKSLKGGNSEIRLMPKGHDVNSLYLEQGADEVKGKILNG